MKNRVLIVEDSVVARELIREIIDSCDDLEVVAEATDGQEAIDLAKQHKPDIITMDLEMPQVDGFQAIQEIMQVRAIPILVVSSVVDAEKAYRAISCGALDAVQKPSVSEEDQKAFIRKVRFISQVPVIKQIRPSLRSKDPSSTQPKASSSCSPLDSSVCKTCKRAVCIASSTGGPQALEAILKNLKGEMNAPIFVAQHISKGFAEGMADWLDSITSLSVKVPQDNETIQVNTVYVSPSEKNMTVTSDNRIRLVPQDEGEIYHPNCNRLLESVADVYGSNAVGVILSGMGSDGHKGLLKIQRYGGTTIGQNESTSVIYGMNKIAMQAGAVDRELPLEEISAAVQKAINLQCRNHPHGGRH